MTSTEPTLYAEQQLADTAVELFQEFEMLLQRAKILYISDVNEQKASFKSLCSLFRKKIRRCEVGEQTMLPSQVSYQCELFSELIKEITHYFPYHTAHKGLIIDLALTSFNDAPSSTILEEVIRVLYDTFLRFYIRAATSKKTFEELMGFYEKGLLAQSITSQFGYALPKELLLTLLSSIITQAKPLIYQGRQLSQSCLRDILNDLRKKEQDNLFALYVVCYQLSNKLLHYLSKNDYISLKEGDLKIGRTIKKGFEQFNLLVHGIDKRHKGLGMRKSQLNLLLSCVKKAFFTIKAYDGAFIGLKAFNNFLKRTQKQEISSVNLPPKVIKPEKKSSREGEALQPKKRSIKRTYKVGLRAPPSLLDDITRLMRERQVLQFIKNAKSEGLIPTFKMFFNALNLHDSKKVDVIETYKNLIRYYHELSYQELNTCLDENRRELRALKAPKLRKTDNSVFPTKFSWNAIKKVPQFNDRACPLPDEISLKEYNWLARNSVKLICRHLNNEAERASAKLTLGKPYTRRGISHVTGSKRNIDEAAYQHVASMFEVANDLGDKVVHVRNILSKENFKDVLYSILAFNSIPHRFRAYVGKSWGVETNWVRNQLVGWRRKLDSTLPSKLQIEPLTSVISGLAASLHASIQSEEELKIISSLQKSRLLPFLGSPVDLTPVLDPSTHFLHELLQQRFASNHREILKKTRQYSTSFSIDEIKGATHAVIQDIEDKIEAINNNSSARENLKEYTKKVKAFLFLLDDPKTSSDLAILFDSYLPGTRFTRSVATLCEAYHASLIQQGKLKHPYTQLKRFFTTIRGVMAFAFARKYPTASAQILNALSAQQCVTLPFQSLNRKRTHLPLNLLTNKELIWIARYPASKKEDVPFLPLKKDKRTSKELSVTDLFKEGKPFWVGIPIYLPQQVTNWRLPKRPKGRFWFKILPSKRIIQCCQRGAKVMQLRFNVPQGATGKIVVDIVLTAPTREPFTHNSGFLSSLDTQFKSPSFPSTDYLSSDFNRPGKYYLAVATNKEELNITPFMERFERIAARLRKYHKKTLPLLQRKNEHNWTNLSGKPGYHSRREAEIRSIHAKKKRLKKELDLLLVMMYLYVGHKTGASYFGWDGVSGITTRGKKGRLAVAVTNMPKKKVLHDLFDEWARDCLSAYKTCLPVSPFTSSTCGACGRKMRDPDTAYDEHVCLNPDCKVYKKRRCRHSNAAWVGAQMLERMVAQLST